jgi:glycerophosphoryl diester phosphodiesterase
MSDMEVLAHRGQWREPSERNSLAALRDALAAGFGIETDVRDCDGELVISHDPPTTGALTLNEFFTTYQMLGARGTLALNIKADGLTKPLQAALAAFEIENYFVFDMSIPDTLHWQRAGVPFYTRQSEYEPTPALYHRAAGVWLDAFAEEWYDIAMIEAHIAAGKQVCIVSPELHKRPHLPLWERLRELPSACSSRLLICTDHPHPCSEFFR